MKLRSIVVATAVIAAVAGSLTAAPAGAQSRAELVRLPLPRYDGTLTPYTFELAYPLMTLVYDTLMWRDANGVARPWLARSVERSDGGRRVTVRIDDGVRWHDGRPLTAADVAFTVGFMTQRFHPRFTPQLSDVEQASVVDRLTVEFRLRRPSLGFEDQPLADLPILPRHIWERVDAGSSAPRGLPVGSGPYRLVGARRDRGYVFRANRRYFRGRPTVGRIRVPIIRREDRTYNALRRRRVDMLPINLPGAAAADLGGSFGIELSEGPLYTGTALALNVRRRPFNNRAVRRTLARALSLKQVARDAVSPATADRGFIHPASPWASRAILHRDDPRAALRSLAEFGLPPIRVLAPESDPVRVEAGRRVVVSLRRAGARAVLTELPRIELGRAIGEDGANPSFDAAIVETPALASYDPDFLARVFGSNPRTAPLNYSGYRSARFDALASRVASAPDRGSRRRAVDAELRLLAAEAPVIPLFFSRGEFAFRPAIYEGWVFVKGSGPLDKRSFLPGAARGGGADEDTTEPTEEDTGMSFLDVVSIVSLVALFAVLAVAAYALVRRRSVERR